MPALAFWLLANCLPFSPRSQSTFQEEASLLEHGLNGDGDDGDDDDDDDDVEVTLADVTMAPPPSDVNVAITDPSQTLSSIGDHATVSSTHGLGIVGVISGNPTDVATTNGITTSFSISNGQIGVVAPDANTGVISGITVSVDASHTATVSMTSTGDVSISFSTNT
jgi:hypothetical protein